MLRFYKCAFDRGFYLACAHRQSVSPDVVKIWETVVTLTGMPWLCFWVWCADRDWFRGGQWYPEEEEEEVESAESPHLV